MLSKFSHVAIVFPQPVRELHLPITRKKSVGRITALSYQPFEIDVAEK
jgi:hypothetical protein